MILEKEKLISLYIDQNLTRKAIANLYNVSEGRIKKLLAKYKIHKPKELVEKNKQEGKFLKYGTLNPWAVESSRKKLEEKLKNRTPEQIENANKKREQTMIKKYGVSNVSKIPGIQQKRELTNLKKYGHKCSFASEKVQTKYKENLIKKYGVDNPSKLEEIKQKKANTFKENYNSETYGYTPELNKKRKETCLKKYGYEFTAQVPEVIEKIRISKQKNGTFNTSKPEQKVKELLLEKFPDTIYQYKEERYPFNCDFYIPSLDLFIEYQGFWSHGFKPYEGTEKDLILLNKWKSKNTKKIYRNAIKTWTVKDTLKRKTAQENNLNWIEFFTFNDFMNWYNTI